MWILNIVAVCKIIYECEKKKNKLIRFSGAIARQLSYFLVSIFVCVCVCDIYGMANSICILLYTCLLCTRIYTLYTRPTYTSCAMRLIRIYVHERLYVHIHSLTNFSCILEGHSTHISTHTRTSYSHILFHSLSSKVNMNKMPAATKYTYNNHIYRTHWKRIRIWI